jgi:hypothetical protein
MANDPSIRINRLRKLRNLLVAFGILLITLMGIFPPWRALSDPDGERTMVSMGYHFIGSPPLSPFGYKSYVIIDYTWIAIQWGLVFLATFTAYKFLNGKISGEN